MLLLFGVWEIPLTDYLYFYLALAVIGFVLCYVLRSSIFVVVPVIAWFAVNHVSRFYRYQVGPQPEYAFQVFLAIAAAVGFSVYGLILNKRGRELRLRKR